MSADNLEDFYDNFKKAQWYGETGFSHLVDAFWVWLVNENHVYMVRDGLEIGKTKIEPHSSRFTIIDSIANWKWK